VRSIRYHEAAEAELLDEIGYLELQAKGLGRRFLAEVRRTENLIAQFPDSGEEIRPGIRRVWFGSSGTGSSTQLKRTVY
jgi:plasmid stabilization system protein ParE